MKKLRLRRPSSVASVVAVVVVLLLIGFLVLSTLGGSGGVTFSSVDESEITTREFESIAIGESRDRIEHRLGKGEDALGFAVFGETRTALEPLDARCFYYGFATTGDGQPLVQLCFSHDKLTLKRRISSPS